MRAHQIRQVDELSGVLKGGEAMLQCGVQEQW